ncbi:MAG: PH domain-containing protein [Gammaproteobacteria bacterium]|nr:PH domain-containing protein [Gammaproteobacteria bacterium]
MTVRASFSEHDNEPVRGLPSALPAGEYILWQGAPDWRSLALNAYRIRHLAVYFGVIIAARGLYLAANGSTVLEALRGCIGPAIFSLICLAIVTGIAVLAARSSWYTITTRRVVIRQGVALASTINLPFKAIDSAQILTRNDGSGDIALTLDREQRVSYLWMWPHVRPWRITRPQPALRSLANPQRAGDVLGRAYADFMPGTTLDASGGAGEETPAAGPRTAIGASA